MRRRVVNVAALVLVCAGAELAAVPAAQARTAPPHAVNGRTTTRRLRAAINSLTVARETPAGYNRARFTLWTDQDGDCQDTRAEVLIEESKRRTTGRCTVLTGLWRSAYDGRSVIRAARLDIDHVVPLQDAWSSGANRWSARRREAYANDLADPRALIAVSQSSNRSKGDRDPAEWVPHLGQCAYIRSWVAIKVRWRLTVDPAERRSLLSWATRCRNPNVTLRAVIIRGGPATGSGSGGATNGGGNSARCTPTSRAGNCYSAGQLCPSAYRGRRGIAANGATILCTNRNGWRWVNVS